MQPRIPNTNIKTTLAIGFAIILFGFGSFLLWAVTAPLGKGVVSQGVVTVETNRKAVQHLYGGIVEELHVRETSPVTKDQILIRLSDSRARAEYAAVRSEYLTTLANHARLIAERQRDPHITFPNELIQEENDPTVRELLHTQRELSSRRQNTLKQEQQIIQENINVLDAYAQNLETVLESRNKQLQLINSEIDDLRTLAGQGYYPRNSLLNLERTLEEINGRRAEDIGSIARARGQISELKLRATKIEQEYQKEVETHLTDIQRRMASLKEQYDAAKDVLERTIIRSPDDGIVLALAVHTIGGIITPGQKIMEIVPKDAELVIEAQIAPQDIDKVHRDQKADLRFSAFDAKNTPVLEGEVISISPDRLIDEATRMPYYQAKITVSPAELEKLGGGHQLLPGMPAEVVIKTGERTMFEYLIDPFLKRLFVSFKEE